MSQSNQVGKLHPGIAALIVIVFIGIVTSVVIVVQNNQNDTPNETTSSQSSNDSSNQNTESASTDVSSYKDGTYSATGSYVSPGGRESIELTVTIKDGVITSTELVQNAEDRESNTKPLLLVGIKTWLLVKK